MSLVATDRVTCPQCVGNRVVSIDDMTDPLGLKVCPSCYGYGEVPADDPAAADEFKRIHAAYAHTRLVLRDRERHIELLHGIRRTERAHAYAVAVRHGFTGSLSEFCDELFSFDRSKLCSECARPLQPDTEANA